MRGRYKIEIAGWKWTPIFQNKRVRYARAEKLELYSSTTFLPVKRRSDTNLCRRFTLVQALSVDEHKQSPARMRYPKFVHYVQNYG